VLMMASAMGWPAGGQSGQHTDLVEVEFRDACLDDTEMPNFVSSFRGTGTAIDALMFALLQEAVCAGLNGRWSRKQTCGARSVKSWVQRSFKIESSSCRDV
jgi:hypothetical protein